ncbi:MAG TPA: CHRD domain-containing protein [Chthoniobacterales bacterium]|nr:CHRD domain-containing protein [Chthoniobacterales bacterium]
MRRFLSGAGWVAAATLLCSVVAQPAFAISSAVNLSTRMVVQTGDNVLIGGFIVYGSGQKKIAVRAIGPSLSIAGKLSDPLVELHDATGNIIASNDNWRTTQESEITAAGLAPASELESALIATINTGPYTVVVKGANSATGIGVMEIYDLDPDGSPARLANISTRGNVLTDDNVMIGGFIVRGDVGKRMLVRARGPSLFLNGIPISGRLMDPTLELRDGNGALIKANDDWRTDQQAEISASTIAPTDDKEPAVVWTLVPGNYTTVVRGANNTTGIALVEMYDLDQPPSADGSTLYITELRPQGAATSQGSGTATLRLAADGKSAVISYTYSNLTGPITGMHVHASDGSILFDIDAATPQPDGSLIWIFGQVGNFSATDILNMIKAGQTYVNIHTAQYPSGEIKGFFNLSTGAQTAPIPSPPPALPPGRRPRPPPDVSFRRQPLARRTR